jgi:hypothetical protein
MLVPGDEQWFLPFATLAVVPIDRFAPQAFRTARPADEPHQLLAAHWFGLGHRNTLMLCLALA